MSVSESLGLCFACRHIDSDLSLLMDKEKSRRLRVFVNVPDLLRFPLLAPNRFCNARCKLQGPLLSVIAR